MMRLMPMPALILKQPRYVQRLLWLLLIGFVWLQLLGTVHRQVHVPSKFAHAATGAAGGAWQLGHAAPSALDQHGSIVCQLFDLACSGLALSATPLLVLASEQSHTPAPLPSLPIRAVVFLAYQAHAPPALI
jgi:hypothetical protein